MEPELKENKEFSRWFEQWIARIQSNSLHEHEPPKGETSWKEEERRRQAEKEPVLRH